MNRKGPTLVSGAGIDSQRKNNKPPASLQELWMELRRTYEARNQHLEPDAEFDRRHIALRKAALAWERYHHGASHAGC